MQLLELGKEYYACLFAVYDGDRMVGRLLVSRSQMSHDLFLRRARPADHPLQPVDYQPLDRFWIKRGY